MTSSVPASSATWAEDGWKVWGSSPGPMSEVELVPAHSVICPSTLPSVLEVAMATGSSPGSAPPPLPQALRARSGTASTAGTTRRESIINSF